MKYIIFDTEGTDKMKDLSRVCQFSAIVLDDDFKIEKVINEFCELPMIDGKRMEMPEGAYKVHGLSNDRLKELSEGKEFPDIVDKYKEYFYGKGILWIGYNVAYDIGAVNSTLRVYNKEEIDFGMRTYNTLKLPKSLNMNYCMMNKVNPYYKKITGKTRPGNFKLTEVYEGVIYKIEVAEEVMEEIMENLGVKLLQPVKAHDALFDSFLTYALFTHTITYSEKYK